MKSKNYRIIELFDGVISPCYIVQVWSESKWVDVSGMFRDESDAKKVVRMLMKSVI